MSWQYKNQIRTRTSRLLPRMGSSLQGFIHCPARSPPCAILKKSDKYHHINCHSSRPTKNASSSPHVPNNSSDLFLINSGSLGSERVEFRIQWQRVTNCNGGARNTLGPGLISANTCLSLSNLRLLVQCLMDYHYFFWPRTRAELCHF